MKPYFTPEALLNLIEQKLKEIELYWGDYSSPRGLHNFGEIDEAQRALHRAEHDLMELKSLNASFVEPEQSIIFYLKRHPQHH